MNQESLTAIMQDQLRRALWEVHNVIDCIPDELWGKPYCGMPLWKHVYHTLHSLDLWLINPRDKAFQEPAFHEKDLNDLDTPPTKAISRQELAAYGAYVEERTLSYVEGLAGLKGVESQEGHDSREGQECQKGVDSREGHDSQKGPGAKELEEKQLLEKPQGCEYTRFTLILAQFRHLHTHMGMLMGFLIADTGKWPRVLGLEGDLPEGEYERFF